jgi:hypothetical protein
MRRRLSSVRNLPWYGFIAAGLLGAASIGIVACVEPTGDVADLPECVMPGDAVSPELLAFLSKARASHTSADAAMKGKDTDLAIAVLDSLVDGAVPAERSPEVREVLADTLARTAEIRSTVGKFDDARADVARGLKLATERTHYRGRLMEVLGAVEAREYDHLVDEIAKREEAGQDSPELKKAATLAKQRAISASQQAIDIQEEVIHKALLEEPIEP